MEATESELWHAYHANRTIENRNRLVERYLRLSTRMAYAIHKHLRRTVTVGELESCGYVALIEAIERYDQAKPGRFSTWALWTIRHRIMDELRENEWKPRLVMERCAKVEAVEMLLASTLGRLPTWDEVADHLHLKGKRREGWRVDCRPALLESLDMVAKENVHSEPSNHPVDTREIDPAILAERHDLQQYTTGGDPRSLYLMASIYEGGMSNSEIGKELGLCEHHVSTLRVRAREWTVQRLIRSGDLHAHPSKKGHQTIATKSHRSANRTAPTASPANQTAARAASIYPAG